MLPGGIGGRSRLRYDSLSESSITPAWILGIGAIAHRQSDAAHAGYVNIKWNSMWILNLCRRK